MADHVIIQARDALIAKLKAGVSSVSGRVFKFGEVRFSELDESNTPCILLQLGDDNAEIMGMNNADDLTPQILEDIRASMIVHCCVKQAGDAELAAYNLRRDVEATIFGSKVNRTLDGKVQRISRTAGSNNRDEAIDLGVYTSQVELAVEIVHLDNQPASFTY